MSKNWPMTSSNCSKLSRAIPRCVLRRSGRTGQPASIFTIVLSVSMRPITAASRGSGSVRMPSTTSWLANYRMHGTCGKAPRARDAQRYATSATDGML